MIKVLFILPGIDGGGIGKIVLSYLSKMDKGEIQSDVMALPTDDGHEPFYFKELERYANRVYLFSLHSYIQRFQDYMMLLRREKYDIVHAHMDEASTIYLFVAKLMGVKVRIAHSHIAHSRKGFKARTIANNVLSLFLKHVTTYKFACGINAAKYLWGSEKNVFIMTNAIDVGEFAFNSAKREKKRAEFGLSNNTKVIGTVGRFHFQKNPYFIVNIVSLLIKKYCDIKFIWIGDGEMRNAVEKYIRKCGLQNYFIILGNRNDVADLLNSMDFFILPSIYEGLPIVGVEAQANGLSCFFSNSITKEIIINENVYSLPISDPQLWANELYGSFENYCQRVNSDVVLQSHYNIDRAARELVNCYKEIVNNQK